MKNNEKIIDFLQQAINLLGEPKDDKPEDFVKGRWYKGTSWEGYAKFEDKEIDNIGIDKSSLKNVRMNNRSEWQPVTDFTELTELLKAEVIKRIGKGKPIGVRDVEKTDYNNEFSGYFTKEMSKDFANELGKRFIYDSNTDTLYCYGEGITIVYENGVFATVANDMQAKLEEAKLKYVNGTEFKSVSSGYKYKVVKGIRIGEVYPNYLHAINSDGSSYGVIYDGGTDTWAEIIPQDKGAVLIEQAKKMGFNKIGIKFKSAFGGSVCEIKTMNKWAYDKDTDSLWADNLNGCVYSDGQWATIIQEPIIIDGKEVEIIDCFWIKLDERMFTKSDILAIQSLNPIFPEILKRMEEKNGDNQ